MVHEVHHNDLTQAHGIAAGKTAGQIGLHFSVYRHMAAGPFQARHQLGGG
ncbi:hypothetical protein H6B10_17120, partial [Gemmiger formicilis]|nr:hypothetical protein [Gemmiger formicilis]